MEESAWRNSQLSIARFYGRVQFDGAEYIIVDKIGRDLFECTAAANKEGRTMAIEPGEPADLIWTKMQPHYKRLKRDRIIQLLEEGKSFEEIAQTKE